jgi:hypothetical protein
VILRRRSVLLLCLWLGLLPGQALALTCAFNYQHMVLDADVGAHVRVVAVDPLGPGVSPDAARGDRRPVVTLMVIQPFHGAVAGERLFLSGIFMYPVEDGPPEYLVGSEWVMFLSRAHREGAEANVPLSPTVYGSSCWHFSALVVDGRVDPKDLRSGWNEAKLKLMRRHADFRRKAIDDAAWRKGLSLEQIEMIDIDTRRLTIDEFARVYRDPGLP